MAGNPSLLETLKELQNLSRVVVQDPEDEDFEAGRISAFQETEEAEQNQDAKSNFGNLRKALANEELDKKYAGKTSSRKSLLTWSDDEEDDDDDDVDDDEEEDGDQDDNDVDDDGDEEVLEEEMQEDLEEDENEVDGNDEEDEEDEAEGNDDVGQVNGDDGHPESDDDDDMGGVEEDYDDASDVDDDDDDDDDENAMNIDFSKLPADLQSAVSETKSDSEDPLSHFTPSAKDDNLKKGLATKSQLDILDKLLESRIRLQKSLQVCNQLPQTDTMQEFRDEATPQVRESYESAKSSMKELLNKLIALQDNLCETNSETSAILTTGKMTSTDPGDEEIPSDTEDEDEEVEKEKKDPPANELNLPSKRKHTLTLSEYGEEVTKRHKAFQTFQESTINKWHEKTRLASSVSSKNFASFDKSVTQQIKQVLMDKERLIKRTQLSRVPLKVLGKQEDALANEHSGDNADLHLKNYDENIFDDGDFYHEMLKELIERKSNIDADDPVAAGRRWLELQKLRSKIKRKVDTRASKGRKVRYDVHTKLVSFMAPQNVGRMGDQARNNLFASLFGQKPSIGFGV